MEATGYQAPRQSARGAVSPTSPRAEFLARFASRTAEKPTEAQTAIPEALALMNGAFLLQITELKTCSTLQKACKSGGNTQSDPSPFLCDSLTRAVAYGVSPASAIRGFGRSRSSGGGAGRRVLGLLEQR